MPPVDHDPGTRTCTNCDTEWNRLELNVTDDGAVQCPNCENLIELHYALRPDVDHVLVRSTTKMSDAAAHQPSDDNPLKPACDVNHRSTTSDAVYMPRAVDRLADSHDDCTYCIGDFDNDGHPHGPMLAHEIASPTTGGDA